VVPEVVKVNLLCCETELKLKSRITYELKLKLEVKLLCELKIN